MENKLSSSPLMSDLEEDGNNTTESGPESPSSGLLDDVKMTPKRRVALVPMEGSRFKGENAAPPSDSWAWRKYGRKLIKGSPYPRGYYRCSSSKGCPARKQVERSKVDPTMLVVTYASDHNRARPLPSRNRQHPQQSNVKLNNPTPELSVSTACENPEAELEPEYKEKPMEISPEESSALTMAEEFCWFGDLGTTTSIFESPIISSIGRGSGESNMFFLTMKEEDEPLFADLGELPECSAVFRHRRGVGPEVQIC